MKSEEQLEQQRAASRRYYARNREARIEYNRRWKLKNTEHRKQYEQSRSKEAAKKRNQIFKELNPDYQKEWYKKNKHTHLERSRARHRRIAAEKRKALNGQTVREIARQEGLRSGYERTLVIQMRKAGTKFEYESIKLPYVLHHNYVPDFYLPKQNIYIEAKGRLTPEDRKKMIAVKSQHPELDIRMVFMNGQNRLSKRSQTTYLQWAEKHGFPAADGVIPDEWLK